jgi:hypothetical protein
MFVDALRAIGRLGPPDWAEDGVTLEAAEHLRSVFAQWRERLSQAGA